MQACWLGDQVLAIRDSEASGGVHLVRLAGARTWQQAWNLTFRHREAVRGLIG